MICFHKTWVTFLQLLCICFFNYFMDFWLFHNNEKFSDPVSQTECWPALSHETVPQLNFSLTCGSPLCREMRLTLPSRDLEPLSAQTPRPGPPRWSLTTSDLVPQGHITNPKWDFPTSVLLQSFRIFLSIKTAFTSKSEKPGFSPAPAFHFRKNYSLMPSFMSSQSTAYTHMPALLFLIYSYTSFPVFKSTARQFLWL